MKYIIGLLICVQGFAQNYTAISIPPELKEKAHAVVRNHETEFYIKDIGEATVKVKGTITVLDEKGDTHASIIIGYNKFSKVNNIEAYLYDENGKQVKKLKKDDIENYSTSSGQNSVDDSYAKVASLKYSKYPYTIDYSYQYTNKNMMFYPTWQAIVDNAEFTSVEQSSFKVSLPKGMQLRYKEKNLPGKVMMGKEDERLTYQWKVSQLKAIENETNSPSYEEIMPMVYTGPTDFKVDDYEGRLNTWDDLGRFYGALNVNRDKVPEALVVKIKDLVKDETDVSKKVQKVYEYLQANTRYVSIQLGIGGWQSMKAEEVSSKGYGDCKALTNFTKGLLKELGIKSYEALVKAGENQPNIQTDFPSFQFNHVFLCVPVQKDTLWLECTSQNNPFGYLGSFTSDRNVVLVTENGGKLVRTPTYAYMDNQLIRNAEIEIKESGEAVANITTKYTGLQQDTYADVVNYLNNEDQKKWLYKNFSLPGVEIVDFSLKEKKDKIPAVVEKLNLHLKNVANKSGTRMFMTLNLLNQQRNVPLPNANRKTQLELISNYIDTDNISFKVPKGYVAEYLPEPVKIETRFGKYSASVQMKDDIITYVREVSMLKGRHPAAAYNEWVDFRKKIVKADKNQIVLVAKP